MIRKTPTPLEQSTAFYGPVPGNIQGGHELMDLNSGRLITRPRVWEIPITDIVIQAVEQMGEDQGIKSLKLNNRRNIIYYPADWIAGVDYADATDANEDDDDSDSDDEEDNDNDNDNEEEYDRVEQDELDEILVEPRETNKPTNENANPIVDGADAEDEDEDDEQKSGDDEPSNKSDNDEPQQPERPVRARTQPERLTYSHMTNKVVHFAKQETATENHTLGTPTTQPRATIEEYNPQLAMVIARSMADINAKVMTHGASYSQQYIVQKGLKIFKERGSEAAMKELDQLHKRNCFTPIDVSQLTANEKRKAQEALMFLTEKRDHSCKGRMVYNGKPTREWLSREDAASPTVALESIMLTAIVDATEERDVMTADVPNAFIQAQMPKLEEGQERVIMKITGVLVDLIIEMAPEVYGPFVTFENGKKVLYVQVLRALYGMLVAALLWYKKFKSDLEEEGFIFNPYDACVANKERNGKQQTVRFHVDDLMSSHVDSKINDEFETWLNKMYGAHGKVKVHRGKIHDYLGMVFNFTTPGKVVVNMCDYVKGMLDDFPIKFKRSDTTPTPATDDLFSEGTSAGYIQGTSGSVSYFCCKRLIPMQTSSPRSTHYDFCVVYESQKAQ